MVNPIESGVVLPEHACDAIKKVLSQDSLNVVAATEASRRMVDEGWKTLEVHEEGVRVIQEAGPAMAAFCAEHCAMGGCAMRGFGIDLVGVDPTTLSAADQERLNFYRTVDETSTVSQMRLGIF